MTDKPFVNTQNLQSFVSEIDIRLNLSKIKVQNPEIRVVYFGTPQFSAYILEKLVEFSLNPPQPISHIGGVITKEPKFSVQAVITGANKPVGRKQVMTSSAVAKIAEKYSIPTLKPTKLDEEFVKNHLSFLEAELYIVVAYGKILPQRLLDIPKLGAINVHGSILPKYRGASPIQAAILNGDQETGVTLMLMDAKMDHGPILSTSVIRLSDQETSDSLSKKMMSDGAQLLIETLPEFVAGKIIPKGQNHAIASSCNLIKKEDGYFDINNPPSPEVLDRMIRAYYPWPTAWTLFRQGSSGQAKIVKFLPGKMVQIEGKKPVKFEDFLRGHPTFPLKSI